MNTVCTETAIRLSHNTPTNLRDTRKELDAAISNLRAEVNRITSSLGEMDQTSPGFVAAISDTNDIVTTLDTLTKASADIAKLEVTATKAMQRVWKRMEKYKPADALLA